MQKNKVKIVPKKLPVEQNELVLLDRVFLRIGSTNTDEMLENCLAKFLPPILKKLTSNHEDIRIKVMELLIHINKRVKNRPEIDLPVESLLLLYQDPTVNTFVTNFSIIYIKMGYPRLELDKKIELIPTILEAIENKPRIHQESMFLQIIYLLEDIQKKGLVREKNPLRLLREKKRLSKVFLDLILDILIVPYGAIKDSNCEAESSNKTIDPKDVPPGLSEASYRKLVESNIKNEDLERLKNTIVHLLNEDIFSDQECSLHLIVACADTRFSVSEWAESKAKSLVNTLQWNLPEVTLPLFQLLLGTEKETDPFLNEGRNRTAVCNRIKLRLFTFMLNISGEGFIQPLTVNSIFYAVNEEQEKNKIRLMGLKFAEMFVRNCDINTAFSCIPLFLSCIYSLLYYDTENFYLGQVYIVIGHVGNRFPEHINGSLNLLELILKNLAKASENLKNHIKDGMILMLPAYKPDLLKKIPNYNFEDKYELLHELLSKYTNSEDNVIRMIAITYIANIFETNHIPSIFELLLATNDSVETISNQAYQTLYGADKKSVLDNDFVVKNHNFPNPKKMIQFVYDQFLALIEINKNQSFYLPFQHHVFLEVILTYSRLCIIHDLDFEKTYKIIDHPVEYTPLIGKRFNEIYENTSCKENCLLQYFLMVLKLATASPNALRLLVELVGCVPELSKVMEMKGINELIYMAREELQRNAAILIAIVIANDDVNFDKRIHLIISKQGSKSLEYQYSTLIILGHCLERRYFRLKEQGVQFCNSKLFYDVISSIMKHLSSKNVELLSGACEAIGVLARSISLSLNRNKERNNLSNKLKIVNCLLDVVQNEKCCLKIQAKAIRSLGLLCVGENFPYSREILIGLMRTAKDVCIVEVAFKISETMITCVEGIYSCEARNPWSCTPQEFRKEHPAGIQHEDDLKWLLDSIINSMAERNSDSKTAMCIWLLCIIYEFLKYEIVQTKVLSIQKVLFGLLSENNIIVNSYFEIVFDTASKSLYLMYNSSEANIQEKLLEQLTKLLEISHKNLPKATKNNVVTCDNKITATPNNYNVIIFKELFDMALDLDKADLIYKFMYIATNSNNFWSSKKAVKFGFVETTKKIGEELRQYLPKILPKLYRYQYDPNVHIQLAMQRVWHAIIPDTQKTITGNQDLILNDLITNLTSNEWRIRYACCSAIGEFLKVTTNRSIYDCMHHLPQLWSQVFDLLSDDNDNIRFVTMNTARNLSKLCVSACDVNRGKLGEKMVEIILPLLIEKGTESDVSEVRAFILEILSQLVKSAGALLTPYLHDLIPALLEMTAETEISQLLYITSKFAGSTENQEIINNLRFEAMKSHYTAAITNQCIKYINNSNVEKIIPKIMNIMKSSTNSGAKISSTHFIALLILHYKQELMPFANKIYSVVFSGLQDKNPSITKKYAKTMGYLVSILKPADIDKFLSQLQSWYFSKEDNALRSAIALSIDSIAEHNNDIFNEYSDKLLPLIFFAKHEENTADTSENSIIILWNDIWVNNCTLMESTIRKHIAEIFNIVSFGFKSELWKIRSQAASCVDTIATKCPKALDEKYIDSFLNLLIENLQGKLWTGKYKVLDAIKNLCVNCRILIKANPKEDSDKIVDALFKEFNKKDIDYKIDVLNTLGSVLETLEINRFEELFKIVEVFLKKESSCLPKEERALYIELRVAIYKCLGKSWPLCPITQEKFQVMFIKRCEEHLLINCLIIKKSILSCLQDFIQKLQILTKNENTEEHKKLLFTLIECFFTILESCLTDTHLNQKVLDLLLALCEKLDLSNNKLVAIFVNTKVESTLMYMVRNLDDVNIKAKLDALSSVMAEEAGSLLEMSKKDT